MLSVYISLIMPIYIHTHTHTHTSTYKCIYIIWPNALLRTHSHSLLMHHVFLHYVCPHTHTHTHTHTHRLLFFCFSYVILCLILYFSGCFAVKIPQCSISRRIHICINIIQYIFMYIYTIICNDMHIYELYCV